VTARSGPQNGDVKFDRLPAHDVVVEIKTTPGWTPAEVKVADTGGAAVPGVWVTVVPAEGLGSVGSGVTDSRGLATPFGFRGSWSTQVVVLASGRDLLGVSETVTLPRWPSPHAQIEVRRCVYVVGVAVAPTATARLDVRAFLDWEDWGRPVPLALTRAQDKGQFAVAALPGRPCVVVLSADGITPHLIRVARTPDGGLLDLGKVPLEPGRTLRGRVTTRSGKPVAGAQVLCDKADWTRYFAAVGGHQATSAEDGSFELAHVPPLPFQVRVRTRDGAEAAETCVADVPIDVVLPLE
jgi:hypothetical protein